LVIEEETSDGIRLNQPAGHLDPMESLEQAVIREALEETAHEFIPEALVGMYLSRYHSKSRGHDVTYLRFTFCGKAGQQYDRPLDDGILRTMWMTRDELAACRERHRSPIVLQCVDDYLAGMRTPLAMLHTHASVFEGGI
jgi:8-oxo-dGTP pyrophosphatase MutT (NUDIX family)